ncbi:hypothetical protein HMPREF0277_1843 [Corynebacterium accolens ATCC 49726]|nr:hypothetical protein HMPREF0277_1843 [Corynebacterium accolens ATCC 49726]
MAEAVSAAAPSKPGSEGLLCWRLAAHDARCGIDKQAAIAQHHRIHVRKAIIIRGRYFQAAAPRVKARNFGALRAAILAVEGQYAALLAKDGGALQKVVCISAGRAQARDGQSRLRDFTMLCGTGIRAAAGTRPGPQEETRGGGCTV